MRLGGAFVVVFLFASFATAQTFHGSIRGRVSDNTGVIPNAVIVLTESHTGWKREATSNAVGEYLFAGLPPATYELTINALRYSGAQFSGLVIGANSRITQDAKLAPGPIDALVITIDDPEAPGNRGPLANAFTTAELIAQPTAGRNIFIMGALAPTVLPTGNAIFVRQQDQSNASLISMAGSARRANTYVIDGVPIVDIQNRATIIPGMETVEEMRVQLGPYDAQVGRTSGGVFNVTVRSGSNEWRGSAVYQNRPDAAQAQLFFASKAGSPRPESSYHLFAGSIGGPIRHDRTFVFVSGEGYRSETPRNTVLRLPTADERRGDFSQSRVTIFDPLTTRPDPANPGRFIRDPFPNNQIPASRLNPVAMAMLPYLPMPTSGKSSPVSASVLDEARQLSAKMTQRWNDRLTTSVTYAWNRSAEPDARFFGGRLFANGADPGDGALVRQVNLLALNQQWIINDKAVLQVRAGLNRFLDDNRGADFDPATLGFDPRFVASAPFGKFPSISVSDYGQGGAFLGDRDRQRGMFYTDTASATLTNLKGRHSLQAGGEYRRIGVDFRNLGGSGYFNFTPDFTNGPDPLLGAAATGDAFASFLLGHPANGGIYTSSPINASVRYAAALLQDEFRITDRLTINAGVRYEFEDGLREAEDRMAVGWAADTLFPLQVGGQRPDGSPLLLKGGLVYAGINGASKMQGSADRWQWSPRASASYSFDDATQVRAGYGLFRAPQQGINSSETGTGTRGYNVTTDLVTTLDNHFIPCNGCSLTSPFSQGIRQPSGNALGVMTGLGGGVEFVDPASAPGYYHRYSFELQRVFAHQLTASASYAGAVGRRLSNGGAGGSFVNINQLELRYQSLGASLFQPVDNPFFGTPLAVGILAGPTIPAAQLLRPYPQFDAVYALRSGQARSRYDALILAIDRPLRDAWGVRANYTFSRQSDNQYSESNFFSEGSAIRNYYDIESEYGLSVLDSPHRLNVTGTIRLPLGFSSSAAATLQSGFPIAIGQAAQNNGLLAGSQRPNIVSRVDPLLANDPVDAFDASCGCIKWLNPAAWTAAAPFTSGAAPRADGRARTPGRRLVDVAIDRPIPLPKGALTIRAEIINVLNARDFRGPNNQLGSATFGEIRSDSGFPRMLQIRGRYAW
jgi:hypothetical protein